ncbi:alpha/beta fold hydrolase [Bizionia sediminis]|uniref:Alpha/beta fold hydrolase n=1 Tax=Bizionia sediminis TaxID=1737064 RepID=A0ABW5KSG3_9FLAO
MIITYKDTAVFYTDEGAGTPIVLLHGFLENSRMWQSLLPVLTKTNRVICIDLLGHGHTGCLGYIHTMELMAETVQAVLNHLNIQQSIFIGHSMGGYVALAFMENNPQAVLKLCLANATAKPDTPERQANRDRAILAVKKNHTIFVRMAVGNLFTAKNQHLRAPQIEAVKTEALKTPVQGIIAALEGMKVRKNRTDILKEANIPKLFILGEQDTVIPSKSSILEAKQTQTNYVMFPDGHMSYIENETLFLNEIMRFIE